LAWDLVSDPDLGQKTRRANWNARLLPLGRTLIRLGLVLLIISGATLLLLELVPGDVAESIIGEDTNLTEEQLTAFRSAHDLDGSLPERYWDWITSTATGDLGRSPITSQPVSDAVRTRLPVTLEVAGLALVAGLLMAVPAAVYAAYRPNRLFDRTVSFVGATLLSIPSFLAALLLVFLLAVKVRLFPVTGWTPISKGVGANLRHAALPVMSLALSEAAVFARLLRNDMVATLQEDYVRAAYAKGLSPSRILFRHALRPSSFSLITVAGVTLGRLIGGAVIVESIYALPGLGSLAVNAISTRDFIVLRGVVLVAAVGFVAVNAVVDMLYYCLDPRIRGRSSR
jgi:peptide/nickel transport system permease protein